MKEFTYSIARVRAKETSLLTETDLEQLLHAESYEAALRFARDHGYQDDGDGEIAPAAERALWEFVGELAGEETLRILRLPADYHNVKASVKAAFSGVDGTNLLLDGGTADKQTIYGCVQTREFQPLPADLAAVCEEAVTVLNQTQDGQLCDIFIDKAMLRSMEETARSGGDSFVRSYVERFIDMANLRTAYRCAVTARNRSFLENAIFEGGSLDTAALQKAAAAGDAALAEFASQTRYESCAAAMQESAAALERACADELMRFWEQARYESFSSAPILAYHYAKTTEIHTVRLILSGKRNGLGEETIKERMRMPYV